MTVETVEFSFDDLCASASEPTRNNVARGPRLYELDAETARTKIEVKDLRKKIVEGDTTACLSVVFGKYRMALDAFGKEGATFFNVPVEKVDAATSAIMAQVEKGTFDAQIVEKQALAKKASEETAKKIKAVDPEVPTNVAGLDMEELDAEPVEEVVAEEKVIPEEEILEA